MNIRYLLFAAFILPCTIQARQTIGPSHTFITNNGQIPLMVNGIEVPVNPMGTEAQQVPVTNLNLIITIPGNDKAMQEIKLLPADLGNTIKIGGYYNTKENRYIVSVLQDRKSVV